MKQNNEKIDLILPNAGSTEGFGEFLNQTGKCGCIIRDEFTTLIKDTNKKYLKDTLEYLSLLYDAGTIKRYTRKKKLENVSNA